jgi:hypothetical protein
MAMMQNEKPNYRKAEREALQLLEEYGLSEPPIDPVAIARGVGVTVSFVRFEGDSDQNVSGYYDCETNVIVVNKHESPLRQTFTVAHELGHKVLHEYWAKSDNCSPELSLASRALAASERFRSLRPS